MLRLLARVLMWMGRLRQIHHLYQQDLLSENLQTLSLYPLSLLLPSWVQVMLIHLQIMSLT